MDYDNDGDMDLISGSYDGGDQNGGAAIFLALRSEDGFASPVAIKDSEGNNLTLDDVPSDKPNTVTFRRSNATEPYLGDWDGDGDLDLVIGSMEGEILLVPNSGTRVKPRFVGPGRLLSHGDRPIRVPGGEAGPVLADWDADGKVDLLSGSASGAVHWFRNVSKDDTPNYEEGVMLIGPTSTDSIGSYDELLHPGTHSRLQVVDWNGDGHLDLLVGDNWSASQRWLRPDLTKEERGKLQPLLAEHQLVTRKMERIGWNRESEMWRLGRRVRGVFKKYATQFRSCWADLATLKEQMEPYLAEGKAHGFVWLLIRKPPPEKSDNK